MSRLVEVAVPLPLQDSFVYTVPEALQERLALGARVKVPFGRRHLVGYAVRFPASTEVAAVKPIETLLVVDAMTGQEAVSVAQAFVDAVPVTGLVLTKIDGDARGGAALSISAVTGLPTGVSVTTNHGANAQTLSAQGSLTIPVGGTLDIAQGATPTGAVSGTLTVTVAYP